MMKKFYFLLISAVALMMSACGDKNAPDGDLSFQYDVQVVGKMAVITVIPSSNSAYFYIQNIYSSDLQGKTPEEYVDSKLNALGEHNATTFNEFLNSKYIRRGHVDEVVSCGMGTTNMILCALVDQQNYRLSEVSVFEYETMENIQAYNDQFVMMDGHYGWYTEVVKGTYTHNDAFIYFDIPSEEQWSTLIARTNAHSDNMGGWLFTSKDNGNTIRIPNGRYWLKNQYSNNEGYYMDIAPDGVKKGFTNKTEQLSVWPAKYFK